MDVQDFDGVSFYGIDHHVRQRGKGQFFGAGAVARPAKVRGALEGKNTLIDAPNRWFGKLRVVLLQLVLDIL